MAIPEALNVTIGFLVSLTASIMNALGLNLLQLDHVKNSSKPLRDQVNECGRPFWHFGLYIYIVSQVVGSTIALNFLKAQWVAPLGSISLIFNFIFARAFIGTEITRKDILGTLVIIVSVVWIVGFGGMGKSNEHLTITQLKSLMIRPVFIAYFSVLNICTFSLFIVTIYIYWILSDENRKLKNIYLKNIKMDKLKKYVGVSMAAVGGLLASQSLLLAKSGTILVVTSFVEHHSQFTDITSWFIISTLAIIAVLQVYCLNVGLKISDSVLVVPIFFGFYTALGLINSIIYYDELNAYPYWVLALVAIGISTLIYGVLLLNQENLENLELQMEDVSEVVHKK
ncbi:2031_t:CDS:2 [Diversispora eburnea]|uniref:2031_t:CDS:1 n=1 Tax=Diversispora eburnea TaxID=1213867 RepID=A0A9N8ZLH5_9GLOM|nr:2031_t:CDS:2 [Diversispora eburnea]